MPYYTSAQLQHEINRLKAENTKLRNETEPLRSRLSKKDESINELKAVILELKAELKRSKPEPEPEPEPEPKPKDVKVGRFSNSGNIYEIKRITKCFVFICIYLEELEIWNDGDGRHDEKRVKIRENDFDGKKYVHYRNRRILAEECEY